MQRPSGMQRWEKSAENFSSGISLYAYPGVSYKP